MKFDKHGCNIEKIKISRPDGSHMKLLIVRPEQQTAPATGVLWLHGGGYLLGFPEMVFMGRAIDLVRECGAVVVSPAYRLSIQRPYPAALEDSYLALCYMKTHAEALGIRENQLMVGGESAGGGLTAALCLYARDKGEVNVSYQMPLYPMLDCEDTASSRDNHAKIWNTRRNHMAWKLSLRACKGRPVPMYASPSRCEDYRGLPPAYTYVCDAEPFSCETLTYIDKLRAADIPAKVDVYPGGYHAFDMMEPDTPAAKLARDRFLQAFRYAQEHYFAEQGAHVLQKAMATESSSSSLP
jgi:acetyl esterase/lipase